MFLQMKTRNLNTQTCGGEWSESYGRTRHISEILEHLVTCWIRDKRAFESRSWGEHFVVSPSPSYRHIGRARCCNGWTRLPTKTEISCPPVRLSFSTAILSRNGDRADDSAAVK